ncbi:MAG: 3'-5' exonuclease [Gammaproteobacteria bacterium]
MFIRPLRIATDRWRQRSGPWAGLFEPYRGDEVVSLDCETSGMDPKEADILSVAAVRVTGRRILTSEALDVHVAAPEEMDPESIRVHRLRRADLAGGLPLADALEQILNFVGNRPLLGYNVRFDGALLDRALRTHFGFGLPNRLVELSEVYLERLGHHDHGAEADLRLETIARRLDMPVPRGRHTALNDAVFTAALWVRLRHGGRPQ